MKAKFKPSTHATSHKLSGIVFASALLLVGFSAQAQNLFVASFFPGDIYEFTPSGGQSTFSSVPVPYAEGLAVNGNGDVFVGDYFGRVYEYTPDGTQSTFATGLGDVDALAFDSAGDLFVGDADSGTIYKFTPTGVKSTFASGVYANAMAIDSAGDLFVADNYHGVISELTPGGAQSTFEPYFSSSGLAFDSAGDLFVTPTIDTSIREFPPGGGPLSATVFVASISARALTCDSAGDLFAVVGTSIYEFTPDGAQSTFASGLIEPYAMAFQPVPEPSDLGLLAVGAAALRFRRSLAASLNSGCSGNSQSKSIRHCQLGNSR